MEPDWPSMELFSICTLAARADTPTPFAAMRLLVMCISQPSSALMASPANSRLRLSMRRKREPWQTIGSSRRSSARPRAIVSVCANPPAARVGSPIRVRRLDAVAGTRGNERPDRDSSAGGSQRLRVPGRPRRPARAASGVAGAGAAPAGSRVEARSPRRPAPCRRCDGQRPDDVIRLHHAQLARVLQPHREGSCLAGRRPLSEAGGCARALAAPSLCHHAAPFGSPREQRGPNRTTRSQAIVYLRMA